MPFIEHQDAEEWWSEHSLQDLELQEDTSPYDLVMTIQQLDFRS